TLTLHGECLTDGTSDLLFDPTWCTVSDTDGNPIENRYTNGTYTCTGLELEIIDTGAPDNPCPSVSGTYEGTLRIRPSSDFNVSCLYTYPCLGTGGHTEYVKIENSSWNVTANWAGYQGDWHNVSFDEPFTLKAGETYNYTIITGSYPQVIHERDYTTLDGSFIHCTGFIDANGKTYDNWIPAIRLSK
ncbi:MAG: hypothetical protein PHY19_07995, partial [Methanocellales archaeon]|nr:hypothetical protein [Methanocellales archaeon]